MRIEWDNDGTTKSLPPGHQMTLDTALPRLIECLSVVFMVPRVLLGRLPGKKLKDAYLSFRETTKYLEEFRVGVLNNVEVVAAKKNKTILGMACHLLYEEVDSH
jgi:hypothetical protein